MRGLRLGVPAIGLSVLAITVVITNATGQNGQETSQLQVPKTWDEWRALAGPSRPRAPVRGNALP